MTVFFTFFVWNTMSVPCEATRKNSRWLDEVWDGFKTLPKKQYVAGLIVDEMCA